MRPELKDKLHGLLVPIVTPMKDDYSLAPEIVPRHIDYLLDGGVEVVIPCGSTGEFASLSDDERCLMIKVTVEATRGRAAVIAGASDTRVANVVKFSRFAAEAGADGVMITPPYYFLPTEDEVYEFFAEIDRAIDIPFLFYNNPATTKFNASYDLIERLSKLDNFGALKENNSQPVRYYEELKLFGDRFPVIPAGEPPAVFNVLSGAPGVMSVAANFNPWLIGDMLQAAREHRIDDAFAAFDKLRAYRAIFEARNMKGYPMYIVFAKLAVNMIGIPAGPPRLPLCEPSAEERERVKEVLQNVMGLSLPSEGA